MIRKSYSLLLSVTGTDVNQLELFPSIPVFHASLPGKRLPGIRRASRSVEEVVFWKWECVIETLRKRFLMRVRQCVTHHDGRFGPVVAHDWPASSEGKRTRSTEREWPSPS